MFFADTRERALAEVERANEIVAVYPKAISIGFLREMDGAWRDAHGLPRLPEPKGHKSTVHWPGSIPVEADAVSRTEPDDEITSPPPIVERAEEQVGAPKSLIPTEPIREEVIIPERRPEAEVHDSPDAMLHEQRADTDSAVPDEVRLEDPVVAEAVRAFMALEDARAALELTSVLRAERTRAETILVILDQQDGALKRTGEDFRFTAARVYLDPAAAIVQWDALVLKHRGNVEAAANRVRKSPEILGPLLTDSPVTLRESVAEMFGFPSTRLAKEGVPQMLRRAVLYTPARREAAKPVERETPDGEKVVGRAKVRLRANAVAAECTAQIGALEERIADLGGVAGAESEVRFAFDWLSPAQRSQAERKLTTRAASGIAGAVVAGNLAEVLGKTHDATKPTGRRGEGHSDL